MMQRALGFLLACVVFGLTASADEAPVSTVAREVTAVLATQAAAWNRGDIEGFMQGYAKTDALRFASGSKVTYGWRATLENYQKGYPDRAAMGTLAFTDLVVTELAPDAVLLFGRWELTREKDKPHGLFTLTFRKMADGWRIIHDHTSGAP